jgi:hypothetical protein
MVKPSQQHTELIEIVAGHLVLLSSVAKHDSAEATLRAVTGSLRLLLVDDLLGRAWKVAGLGGPIVIDTWSIVRTGPGEIVAFCGGGEILPGIAVSAGRHAGSERKTLNWHDFRRQARVQIGSVKISTAEVVQYIANKRGGVHFDPTSATPKTPKFELLRQVEAGEIEGPALRFNDRSLLHHEILSIGQSVIRSAQVERLRIWAAAA